MQQYVPDNISIGGLNELLCIIYVLVDQRRYPRRRFAVCAVTQIPIDTSFVNPYIDLATSRHHIEHTPLTGHIKVSLRESPTRISPTESKTHVPDVEG